MLFKIYLVSTVVIGGGGGERGAIKNFLCNLQKSSTGRKFLLLMMDAFLLFLLHSNVNQNNVKKNK